MKCTGIVQEGSKRARALGYPTINIPLSDASVSGVFAARVSFLNGTTHAAAAFADPSRMILEAHLFDFSREMYGEEATIELVAKIRETQRFASDESLKTAIAEDVAAVKDALKS